MACRARISAPPSRCLAVVLDAASYPLWSRFCRSCAVVEGGGPPGEMLLALGSRFVFDVHMDLDEEAGEGDAGGGGVTGRATPLEVSVLEAVGGGEGDGGGAATRGRGEEGTGRGGGGGSGGERRGWRVAWKTRGMPSFVLRSERVQEFLEAAEDGNATDYVCWETFYGLLAPVVRLAVGPKLERGFGAWMDDLKARAETLHSRTGEESENDAKREMV